MSARIVAWAARVGDREGADAPVGEGPWRAAGTPRAAWPEGPDRLGRMDRPAAWSLITARRVAAALAGFDDVGVILGTALGCAEVNARYHRGLVTQGASHASPMLFAQTLPATPAAEAAIAFGARGHSATIMAGRASGIAAVAEALRALRHGRLRAALVLAGDAFGPDEVALRAARGGGPAAEVFVALGLVGDDDAPADAPRVVEATVRHDRANPDAPDVDLLGASGLLELVRWLDARDEVFAAEVRCASGRVGTLRATRGPRC
ncbi:MAG: beta-ketoacyl synthase N-terminal-like domain-containing protein [Polyangiales bacterium]